MTTYQDLRCKFNAKTIYSYCLNELDTSLKLNDVAEPLHKKALHEFQDFYEHYFTEYVPSLEAVSVGLLIYIQKLIDKKEQISFSAVVSNIQKSSYVEVPLTLDELIQIPDKHDNFVTIAIKDASEEISFADIAWFYSNRLHDICIANGATNKFYENIGIYQKATSYIKELSNKKISSTSQSCQLLLNTCDILNSFVNDISVVSALEYTLLWENYKSNEKNIDTSTDSATTIYFGSIARNFNKKDTVLDINAENFDKLYDKLFDEHYLLLLENIYKNEVDDLLFDTDYVFSLLKENEFYTEGHIRQSKHVDAIKLQVPIHNHITCLRDMNAMYFFAFCNYLQKENITGEPYRFWLSTFSFIMYNCRYRYAPNSISDEKILDTVENILKHCFYKIIKIIPHTKLE